VRVRNKEDCPKNKESSQKVRKICSKIKKISKKQVKGGLFYKRKIKENRVKIGRKG
jgi:hypothetical protein